MANALQSTMAAVNAGFIGKNPLEGKLAAIDKGIIGVQAWKANIDKQRLELKQNTAKQIREAELKAYENMPSDETAQAKVLEGLAKYKNQMLTNERLVRNGSVPPEENLIFFENGKQSFDIFAQNVSNYDKELELTKKRAQGYTDPDTGEFVQPTSGELEAAMQKIQTAIGTLSGIDINFSERGMGQIDFYQMEVDPKTHTYRPKVDENGNKIPIKGQSNMSVLALKHKANGRADRVNVSGLTETFTKKGLASTYDVMATEGLMVGNVVNDLRNNPDRASILNNAVAADSSGIQQVASILSKDNGIPTEYVPFNEWDMLSDADKNETIEVTILDENMEEKSVNVKKYVRVAAANENNAIVPEMDEDQIAAAQGYLRKSYADALQRKITKGSKRSEFDPYSNSSGRGAAKKETDTFNLIDQVVRDGNSNSLEAIVRQDPNIDDYEVTDDGIVFTRADGTLTAPIDVSGGAAVDAGKILASELGYNAEAYSNKSKAGSGLINSRVKDFEGFKEPGEQYGGLGGLAMAKDKDGIVYASEYVKKDDEDKMAAQAQVVVDKARAKYGDMPNIKVGFDDLSNMDGTDEISITIDGVKYKNVGYTSDNHKWLMENLDRALSGQEVQGTSKSSKGKYD